MKKIQKLVLSVSSLLLLVGVVLPTTAYAMEMPPGVNDCGESSCENNIGGPGFDGEDYIRFSDHLRITPGVWEQRGGHWYFLQNGLPVSNMWIEDAQGRWFRIGSNRRMVTGWYSVGGNYFSFTTSGVMRTGWHLSGGNWYFLGTVRGVNLGAMQTGWKQSAVGNWYFLNPHSWQANHTTGVPEGAMASGTTRWIGSRWELFNRSGRWQGQFNPPGGERRHFPGWSPPAPSGNTTINLRFSQTLLNNMTWATAVSQGVDQWNARVSTTRVRFQVGMTGQLVDMQLQNPYNHGWFGSFRTINPGTLAGLQGANLRSFQLNLYTSRINSYPLGSGTTRSNVITNVMVHELGHTIGLEDGFRLGGSYNSSVMNGNRTRTNTGVPTTFDVNTARMIYE